VPSGVDKAAAARRLGLHESESGLSLNRRSLLASVGGLLGILESIVPTLVFVVVYSATLNLVLAVASAGALSLVSISIQLVRKKPVVQAIAGAIGVAIAAFLPLREGGKPADYFLTGFLWNAVYIFALTLSVIVRWPLIGVLVGALNGMGAGWRKQKSLYRKAQLATALFISVFSLRLLVQVPLYLNDQIALLGVMRVAMGVPLYAIAIWFSWLLLRGSISTRQ
jgi:hypothetical protein